jgi:uncharacterized coiled-coil DUF342 family protein
MTTLETQQKNEIARLTNEIKGLIEQRDKVKAEREQLREDLHNSRESAKELQYQLNQAKEEIKKLQSE